MLSSSYSLSHPVLKLAKFNAQCMDSLEASPSLSPISVEAAPPSQSISEASQSAHLASQAFPDTLPCFSSHAQEAWRIPHASKFQQRCWIAAFQISSFPCGWSIVSLYGSILPGSPVYSDFPYLLPFRSLALKPSLSQFLGCSLLKVSRNCPALFLTSS